MGDKYFCSIYIYMYVVMMKLSQKPNRKTENKDFQNIAFQVLQVENVLKSMHEQDFLGKMICEKHVLSFFFSIQIYCINIIIQSKQTHSKIVFEKFTSLYIFHPILYYHV